MARRLLATTLVFLLCGPPAAADPNSTPPPSTWWRGVQAELPPQGSRERYLLYLLSTESPMNRRGFALAKTLGVTLRELDKLAIGMMDRRLIDWHGPPHPYYWLQARASLDPNAVWRRAPQGFLSPEERAVLTELTRLDGRFGKGRGDLLKGARFWKAGVAESIPGPLIDAAITRLHAEQVIVEQHGRYLLPERLDVERGLAWWGSFFRFTPAERRALIALSGPSSHFSQDGLAEALEEAPWRVRQHLLELERQRVVTRLRLLRVPSHGYYALDALPRPWPKDARVAEVWVLSDRRAAPSREPVPVRTRRYAPSRKARVVNRITYLQDRLAALRRRLAGLGVRPRARVRSRGARSGASRAARARRRTGGRNRRR